MKKLFLITYAFIYTISVLLMSIISFINEPSIPIIVSLSFSFLYLLGFYGYSTNKKIVNYKFWKCVFLLLCIATSAQLILTLDITDQQQIIYSCLNIIFLYPLAYSLYKYSLKDQELWATSEDIDKSKIISEILKNKTTIYIEKNTDISKVTVTISKSDNYHTVKINRSKMGDDELFQKDFSSVHVLINFFEQYSNILVEDFRIKYT